MTVIDNPQNGAGIPRCCEVNIRNKNPQVTNYNSESITINQSGKVINKGMDIFQEAIASGTRTAYSQPFFKTYADYILYLQGKNTFGV